MDNLNFYTFRFDRWQLAVMSSVACLVLITMGIGGYLLNGKRSNDGIYVQALDIWEQRLHVQAEEVHSIRQQAAAQLEMLTTRVAELQAQFYQVEGLSQRIAQVAQLDAQELAYFNSPAYQQYAWGNAVDIPATTPTDFMQTLEKLEGQIMTRSEQLVILEKLLLQRELTETMSGIATIVDQGWISSPYGQRTDPFTQKQTWHDGVDISAAPGTPIKAIAAGIVSFAGHRAGYGHVVEIDHGNGFATLYAHNRNNLVIMGDIVNTGQTIAQMGSSGRSTGPHVHFEISRNGTSLNPLPYIQAGYN